MNTHAHPEPHHHPEPPLTPELFADLLDPTKSAFDLCHEHDLTLDQLHAAATGHHFRHCVAMLDDIAAARTAAQRPERERAALDTLDRIAAQSTATPTHAETVRRAASATLRHPPTRAATAQPQPQHPAEPPAQHPTPTRPARTPQTPTIREHPPRPSQPSLNQSTLNQSTTTPNHPPSAPANRADQPPPTTRAA